MTSSQPVTTPDSLIFTPDNKNCFAYSGGYGGSTAGVTALSFSTQSEYIIGEFHLCVGLQDGSASSCASYAQIKFNNLLIGNLWAGMGGADAMSIATIKLIIPPFTEVTGFMYSDENQSARKQTLSFVGEAVGMTTTGYQ
jgi:hypothetical protein